MTAVNRVFMLKGIPLLRDLPPFSKVPPFRGLANIRHLDFPAEDEARLAAVCGAGQGDLHHAEPSRVLHRLDDRQGDHRARQPARRVLGHAWRRQRPGPAGAEILAGQQSDRADPRQQRRGARAFGRLGARRAMACCCIPKAASAGTAIYVAPLLPGAVEMALEALDDRPTSPTRASRPGSRRSSGSSPSPDDVEKPLLAECAYVERRLQDRGRRHPACRCPSAIYRIYETLLGARRGAARAEPPPAACPSPSGRRR